MMRRSCRHRSVLLIALLLGCTPDLPARPTTPQELDPVISAWVELGNPVDLNCPKPPVIYVHTDDEMISYCRREICDRPPQDGCADSCYFPGNKIIISDRYPGQGWITHETFHWLQWCAGMPQDHSDLRIWGLDGVLHKLGG